ncbi:dynein regulatory complex subunit 7 isoform X2 [Pelobates fuscus]
MDQELHHGNMKENILTERDLHRTPEHGEIRENILTERDLHEMQEYISKFETTEAESIRECLDQFPASYTSNSTKEQLLLSLAENFWRQYSYLYPDRQPLFLNPRNECDIEKFVCTTLRPTLIPYPELYNWAECACFVSEYLTMQPLDPPHDLPHSLFSSNTVLQKQQGNCFDFSVLLCSLLLGAGYDAYCVSGYATKEMCVMDESREVCPLLLKQKESLGEISVKHTKKYSVKPPRQFISKFEVEQESKREEQIHLAQQKQQEEEKQRLKEAEKPVSDPLYGRRIHCWVLVLSGKREVPENLFIDSFTGKSFDTKDDHFLGIESVWNHENYWVNMQDCRNGCKDMTFDLGDPACWEFFLQGSSKPQLLIPDAEDEEDGNDVDQDGSPMPEMLPSWVLPIVITPKEFETRCPQGKKVLQYRKAKLEKWAPFMEKNGQVSRLTLYLDTNCSQEVEIKDWFEHRQDKLHLKHHNKQTGITSEYFSPGRADALKVHVYRSLAPETERSMVFYSESRLDGLQTRDEKPREMTETFQGRLDLLYYRHTQFGKKPKKVAIAGGPTETNPRPILKIMERFHRNTEKAANEDVAERIFLIRENRIQLQCHRENDHIITSFWEFLKPSNLGEKGTHVILTPETALSFQAKNCERFNKQLYVYERLVSLQQEEMIVKKVVRNSEAEVLEILSVRSQEEADPQFAISIYDIERNVKSKEQQEARKRALREEEEQNDNMDYLAPFLAQFKDPVKKLTRAQAQQVKEDCLNDLKQRQIEKANLIQARFEKETQELQKKQQWYQQNQVSMSREDEESYVEYCSEAMFRIQILDKRLNRHKELAPQKYLALEDQLSKDPRLTELFLAL